MNKIKFNLAKINIELVTDDCNLFQRFVKEIPNNRFKNHYKKKYFIYIKKTSKKPTIKTKSNFITIIYYPKKNLKFRNLFLTVKLVLQKMLLNENILFFHASSFIKNKKAYLFCGPSGSGKSTIIKSLSPKEILSDDIAIVRRIDDNFFVFPSIFDFKKIKITDKTVKLKKIYFLNKRHRQKDDKKIELNDLFNLLVKNSLVFQRVPFLGEKIIKEKKEKFYKILFKIVFDIYKKNSIEVTKTNLQYLLDFFCQ